jgi:hypothetical protein
MFVCRSDDCNREFDIKSARSSHEGHSHEGVASKIIDCKQCGSSFKAERGELENGRKYCSQECAGLAKRESDSWFYCRSCGDKLKEEGDANCNYCSGCQIFDCRVDECGRSFPSKSSRASHEGQIHPEFNSNQSVCVGDGCGEVLETKVKYCDECRTERRSELFSGEDNPMYKDGSAVREEKECKYCGDSFSGAIRQFCSRRCYADWQSENRTGANHHNYQGGERYVYGSGWSSIREEAIQRDNGKCIECGMEREVHKEKYNKDLSVDHIRRKFIDEGGNINDDEANDLGNLRTLCFSCHTKLEFEKEEV